MSKRQSQNSGTTDVREAHRFDVDRLQSYMESHVEGFRGQLKVSQFKGGQSNPTYKLQAESGSYVLRRKPPGKLLKSAHAVEREFQIISALYGTGFPVPRPYVLCEDAAVVGTPFFIMECVEGRIFWNLDLPELAAKERSALYDNVNETLAKLHNLDFLASGLDGFGKPGNYFSRQISRWTGQYRASETDVIEPMNQLIDWLPANIPADDSVSIVHGDYRLDNMVVHPTEPRVIAVLDWELSTIGHPLADFTYHLMGWQMANLGIGSSGLFGKDLVELGIPDQESYIARYCERTGRADGIDNRHFYFAFNFFRLAAILQGIVGRVRDGTAASAHAEQAVKAVSPLSTQGWQYAKQK